jgi:hypothetical protein
MLSSIATLLGAAKRRPKEVAVVVVQKSDACIDLSARSQSLLLVASVGVCHKAIFGFVGDGDGFFLGLEGCDRDGRSKHLLRDLMSRVTFLKTVSWTKNPFLQAGSEGKFPWAAI